MRRKNTQLCKATLEKDSRKADKKLWNVEKTHLRKPDLSANITDSEQSDEKRDRRITEEALSAAEKVQKQYAEYQKFYTKEVARLNSRLKEQNCAFIAKENEFKCKAKELTEQIKVLEIDQKNLIKAKEIQTNAKEMVQQDQERLTQTVQQLEVQKLTRKYKLASVVEQLSSLTGRSNQTNHNRHHNEQEVILGCVINQLNAMREEDVQNSLLTR
uniref:Uncharacterized protein n=1 Tax=Ditylenchus dipsaci TaxID=166011 RepID=A0A915EKK8_9BILA